MKKGRLTHFLIISLILWYPNGAYADPLNLAGSSTFSDQAFDDPRDIFTISNKSDLGIKLSEVVINLSLARLFVDTNSSSGFPFTIDSGAIETGFVSVSGDTNGSTNLKMLFSDFDTGEVFSFFIDIDDGSTSGIVTGDEFAGSVLTMTFVDDIIDDTDLSALYQRTGPYEATAQIQVFLTGPLLFTAVTPCRIVDTRKAGGAIPPGGIRSYNVREAVASQGGNPAGCPSPEGEPYGVHLNVTAVPVAGSGNFLAYSFGSAPPGASFVNYKTGVQNIANSGAINTCFKCAKDISIKSNFGTAHLVIDVLGYYNKAP